MTPNGTAIRAIRKSLHLSLRDLAQFTGLDRGYLSRVERGLAGAGEETIRRIAVALEVPPAVITRGEDVPTSKKEKPKRQVPLPSSPEGQDFHYLPDEIEDNGFLPWSALQIKRMAYARKIPFNGGASKITLTGRDICEIRAMTAIEPLDGHRLRKPTSAA